jgi:hypothetical protein
MFSCYNSPDFLRNNDGYVINSKGFELSDLRWENNFRFEI